MYYIRLLCDVGVLVSIVKYHGYVVIAAKMEY
jgi:hypothetical protein